MFMRLKWLEMVVSKNRFGFALETTGFTDFGGLGMLSNHG